MKGEKKNVLYFGFKILPDLPVFAGSHSFQFAVESFQFVCLGWPSFSWRMLVDSHPPFHLGGGDGVQSRTCVCLFAFD